MKPLIIAGSTLASYKVGDGDRWLANFEAMAADAKAAGANLRPFAALETDARGLEPYRPLHGRLEALSGRWWAFQMDTGAAMLDSDERLAHICMGRNLVTEYAVRSRAAWCLFLDSDLTPPPDAISKLLELGHPIVGGDVPHYCLSGPPVPRFPFPVEAYEYNTAGFLMVRRDLFRRLRWRYDLEADMTDDPCYAADARQLGYTTLVRKDLVGDHQPLIPVEARGHDLRIRRPAHAAP